jgi:hypothetical protein
VSSREEQHAWVDTWAKHIESRGLSPVVLLLLEAARAFGFLGSQALLMAQPLMNGLLNDSTVERTIALLESPELLERLKVRLEGEEG